LEYGYMQLNWQTRVLIKLGFSANAITVLSLILATVGAYYLGIGRFFIGGWFMFLSFFCDAYDGLIARAMGTASVRGEYFDSFIDRYADIITSFGFLWYYKDDYLGASAVALGILGSAAMGYAKAKGEAVGVDPNVGIMQRHERGVWLGCFTTMAPLFAAFLEPDVAEKYFRGLGGHPRYHAAIFALAVVGVLSNVSAVWRAAYVMKRLPRPGAKTTMPATPPAPSQAIKETAQS
jgi:CDP-diacylglycerol--glycerol-3-phosphate 3-phosphatidyltransferase